MKCATCKTGGIRSIAELEIHRGLACSRGGWDVVVDLRAAGDLEGAERAARKAMGIHGEPMSEETKEKLRKYQIEHAEEIKARAAIKAAAKARTRAIMKPQAGPIRRK